MQILQLWHLFIARNLYAYTSAPNTPTEYAVLGLSNDEIVRLKMSSVRWKLETEVA